MRNRRGAGAWVALTLVAGAAAAMAALGTVGGCVPPDGAAGGPGAKAPPPKPLKRDEVQATLEAAYAAFAGRQYNEAMAGAERILASNPQGPGLAEAQYLRGRVLEERAQAVPAGNVAAARSAMQAARDAYNAALLLAPAPDLEGSIRAQLANVAFHQEDYATAIAQGLSAYEKLADPQERGRVLYRVARSQQRFGNFPEADRTFAAVQQQFPSTELAKQAAAHQGARGFHVQVGTFSTPANADAALADLRTIGIIGLTLPNPAGQQVVRVGPAPTYEQAKAVRARLAGKYPDAIIVP